MEQCFYGHAHGPWFCDAKTKFVPAGRAANWAATRIVIGGVGSGWWRSSMPGGRWHDQAAGGAAGGVAGQAARGSASQVARLAAGNPVGRQGATLCHRYSASQEHCFPTWQPQTASATRLRVLNVQHSHCSHKICFLGVLGQK